MNEPTSGEFEPTESLNGAQASTGEEGSMLDNLNEDLAAKSAEIDSLKDKLLRSAAELENMRRRFEREKSDLLQYGQERLMADLLPVLDSVDRALIELAASDADSPAKKGFELTQKQLSDALGRHGLKEIECAAAQFDPNLHQAISRVESEEVTDEQVSQVFAKGYLLNGRLLRAAVVSVAVPKGE